MAVTLKNKLLIAYKKLVGKSHTNSQFDDVNESIASSIQIGADKVFGETIPETPNSNLYDITDNVVERIDFELDPLPLSQYTANGSVNGGIEDDGDGAPNLGIFSSGYHAYTLRLPSNYESNSTNPRKGTNQFLNNQQLSGSKRLQLVPSTYGINYIPSVSHANGIISPLDEENYHVDTFSGILFIQDINRTPEKVSGYLYIGRYTDEKVTVETGSFGTLEATSVSASAYINLPQLERVITNENYSLSTTERAIFVTNDVSSSITVTLPSAASAESREYHITKADSNAGSVLIVPQPSELVNGKTQFGLHGPYQSVTLITDGTDWYVF